MEILVLKIKKKKKNVLCKINCSFEIQDGCKLHANISRAENKKGGGGK